MEFFAKNYNYIIFLSFWAYVCFALACFILQKLKISKISYHWFVVFAICGAIVNFVETFSYGGVISTKNLYSIQCILIYIYNISFFIAIELIFSKFKKVKFLNYYIFPLLVIPLAVYCFFGATGFKFITSCFFIIALVLIIFIEYNYYRVISNEKRKFAGIIIFSVFFGASVCIFNFFDIFKINSSILLAILQMIKAVSLFTISNLIFKHSKVIHEKEVNIYEYIPFYWKHIPLASVLVLILVSGFFLSNHLETVSKDTIIEETDLINEDITETSFVVLEKTEQICKSLSNSPFLKESLVNMSPDNDPDIAKMLNSYKNSFGISLVCILDIRGRIVYYSDYPDMDFSKKKKIYNENAKFFEHLKDWIKEGFIGDYNYIDKGNFYSASIIDSSKYGKVGIVVVKESVLSIVKELNKGGNVFIINAHGKVLMSGEENAKIKKLWNFSGSSSEKKSLVLSEIKDKDIISINNEQFYVSRKFLKRENWSVVKLAHLGSINQSKALGYLITSTFIIILLLVYYSINQSNKVLALALLHQDILDSAKSVIIISTDLQGKIVVCGHGSREITGYSLEEFKQTDFFETIFFSKDKKPIIFNEAVSLNIKSNLEWLCRRKDGIYINVLIYIVPQFSILGKVIGYIFSGLDITETKRAERNLEEQFQFLQSLLDNIPVAIYYKNAEMRLIGCNKAFEEMVSHSKNEIIGSSVETLFRDEKVELFLQKTDLQISKDMEPISYELPVFFLNKGIINLIFYKSAFKNLAGKFGGIIGVLIDITKERQIQIERDKLQSKLIQQNKLVSLGELAGSIAHELNNPLSIIMGFSQVLYRDKSLDEETVKGIKNIYDAALRSQKIIKNMLEFSRTNTSSIQKTDLNNVIESTLFIIEKEFIKAGIEVVKNFIGNSILIQSNAMQMQQVILNILLNAKDAMTSGGKLTIKTEVSEGNYILSISDTGVGINPEIVSKIFDPFFTTKEVGKGTGLGLSICYGIVKNLQGEISVESVVGKGTTFYIKFPIAI